MTVDVPAIEIRSNSRPSATTVGDDAQAPFDQFLRSTIEGCSSGMLLVDATGKIQFANAKILEWFGYAGEELIGKSVEILIPSERCVAHIQMRDAYFARPTARPMGEGRDLCGVTKSGMELPIEIGLNPVATPAGVHALVNIINISRRRRTEAALLAKSHDMEQLMYIVSHDLRSPLVTIEGFSSMITQHLEAHQLDRVADDLARVKRATHTMAQLISNVLSLSRINRQTLKLQTFKTREVLDEAAASLDGPLGQAGAQLAIVGDFPTLRADRSKLLQIFLNFIGNALKYACQKPGATITVGTRPCGLDFGFFVQDEGAGVDPVVRKTIFQPFQRGAQSGDGTGLGLAIVYAIMEMHDGRTWVDSAPDGGAMFWVAFPAAAIVQLPNHESGNVG